LRRIADVAGDIVAPNAGPTTCDEIESIEN
jgi:hypothetical protein